ncbi:MAG: sugar transferase [Tannerellaceae bacterium]|jgi:exopolysaccharide biosynthesis polyprenyl glycosylphosphotransferase|nr:sugar transferase [Tannerellaceae bacterium]
MNPGVQRFKYIFADILSASAVWLLFNVLRYDEVASYLGYTSLTSYLTYTVVWEVQLAIPFFWLTLYYFSGYYNKPFGKSRLGEFFLTLATVVCGVTLLFFILILNDLPRSFHIYYHLYFALLALQFVFTWLPRLFITQKGLNKVKRREWSLNVLIIGTGPKAVQIAGDLYNMGYRIVGFVTEDNPPANEAGTADIAVDPSLLLGTTNDLPDIVPTRRIDEIVVAVESTDSAKRTLVLYPLYRYKCPVKILADNLNMLLPLSKVKIKTIRGLPLVDVTDNNFSGAEQNIKFWMDKCISALALVLLSPVYLYIAWRVKKDSPGPALFRQERIGYRGRPFMMYKFRTMYTGSENDGPLLSNGNDSRVTPFGRLMRKYRIDELPQFWNVLKGDMSLVGPRPERRYFIDRIVSRAPFYYLLHNVRPGLTSLGMVKYGYASNVDQMIERLEYDMLYYENMSLVFDLTILVYTIKTVITGKGI